jgi:hypothetical protein
MVCLTVTLACSHFFFVGDVLKLLVQLLQLVFEVFAIGLGGGTGNV